jgi:hypothetical protein
MMENDGKAQHKRPWSALISHTQFCRCRSFSDILAACHFINVSGFSDRLLVIQLPTSTGNEHTLRTAQTNYGHGKLLLLLLLPCGLAYS